jgi:serine/threonine protein phosphatase PrpC
MNYTYSARTDPGKVRGNNEDALGFDASAGVALLADGMGGYQAGEVASDMAVELIRTELCRWLAEVGEQANIREIRRAIEICTGNANQSIFQAAVECPQFAGMGTTLVVAVFQGERLILGHIGDSRCYRMRRDELRQITRDHSLLQEQIDARLITKEQAAVSAHKNLLTRALGVEHGALLELNDFQVESGDVYLLCSDGLTDMVTDGAIAEVLRSQVSLDHMGQSLVDLANRQGGRDNVSVILVRAGAQGARSGLVSRLLGK